MTEVRVWPQNIAGSREHMAGHTLKFWARHGRCTSLCKGGDLLYTLLLVNNQTPPNKSRFSYFQFVHFCTLLSFPTRA